jgi:hypothetical protein
MTRHERGKKLILEFFGLILNYFLYVKDFIVQPTNLVKNVDIIETIANILLSILLSYTIVQFLDNYVLDGIKLVNSIKIMNVLILFITQTFLLTLAFSFILWILNFVLKIHNYSLKEVIIYFSSMYVTILPILLVGFYLIAHNLLSELDTFFNQIGKGLIVLAFLSQFYFVYKLIRKEYKYKFIPIILVVLVSSGAGYINKYFSNNDFGINFLLDTKTFCQDKIKQRIDKDIEENKSCSFDCYFEQYKGCVNLH